MIKKFFVGLAAVAALFVFVACGGSEEVETIDHVGEFLSQFESIFLGVTSDWQDDVSAGFVVSGDHREGIYVRDRADNAISNMPFIYDDGFGTPFVAQRYWLFNKADMPLIAIDFVGFMSPFDLLFIYHFDGDDFVKICDIGITWQGVDAMFGEGFIRIFANDDDEMILYVPAMQNGGVTGGLFYSLNQRDEHGNFLLLDGWEAGFLAGRPGYILFGEGVYFAEEDFERMSGEADFISHIPHIEVEGFRELELITRSYEEKDDLVDPLESFLAKFESIHLGAAWDWQDDGTAGFVVSERGEQGVHVRDRDGNAFVDVPFVYMISDEMPMVANQYWLFGDEDQLPLVLINYMGSMRPSDVLFAYGFDGEEYVRINDQGIIWGGFNPISGESFVRIFANDDGEVILYIADQFNGGIVGGSFIPIRQGDEHRIGYSFGWGVGREGYIVFGEGIYFTYEEFERIRASDDFMRYIPRIGREGLESLL